MKFDTKAVALLSMLACGTFSPCSLAAPQSGASSGDVIAAHTEALIRMHHESIALRGSMPAVQRNVESRICEQPVDPARDDAKRFLH